jgi:serine/threonine-protein kinase RsbW
MIDRHEFPNSPYVVARARRFVTQRLDGVSPELTRVVGLLVSELVTNCVRHTASDFTVEIEQNTRDITVRVTDRGEGEPIMRSPDASSPSGRGLRLVEKLADSFGVTHDAARSAGDQRANKTVWFVVRLDAATTDVASDERGAEIGFRRRPAGGARSRGAQGERASKLR